MTDKIEKTREKIQDALNNIDEPGGEAGMLVGLVRERLSSAIMILEAAAKAETVPEVVKAIEDAQAEGVQDQADSDAPKA